MQNARNFQWKSDSECCIARYNLIYTQATARWKFGDTLGYSETCCYVDRSKNFKLGNWVFVADSQKQLLFTISFIQQAFL